MRSLRSKKKRARKPKPPEPIARFRVYGYKSSLYFIVNVWATKRDLHANRRAQGLDKTDCDAHVFSYDEIRVRPDRPARKLPIVGEINFHRQRLGVGVISHECAHATASLLRRLRFDFNALNVDRTTDACDMNAEELFCYTLGEFARAITVQLYKRKFIE